VIRRAFWLGAGAAAGIMGYRRVSALGRTLSGTVTGTVAGAGAGSQTAGRAPVTGTRAARLTARKAFRMARGTARFSRDVREGMDLYMARQNGPRPSTLRAHTEPDTKDGR
jgi:hypothetical protein